MTLLDFARGTAMEIALAIFLFGMLWRLIGVLLQPGRREFATPRKRLSWVTGLQGLWAHVWPYKPFVKRVSTQYAIGYILHIGLAVVILFYAAHISFFRSFLGFGWPNLPNGVITFFALLTIAALVFAMVKRLTDPVLKRISNFDDYATWVLTIAPLLTGLAVKWNFYPVYETGLAIHLLSVWALLIYFPFGKLMHAFWFGFSRYTTGVRFQRKGGLA